MFRLSLLFLYVSAKEGSTSVVRPLILVKPSKRKPVTAVVLVSLAMIELNDFGSVVVERTSSPPYFPGGKDFSGGFVQEVKTAVNRK